MILQIMRRTFTCDAVSHVKVASNNNSLNYALYKWCAIFADIHSTRNWSAMLANRPQIINKSIENDPQYINTQRSESQQKYSGSNTTPSSAVGWRSMQNLDSAQCFFQLAGSAEVPTAAERRTLRFRHVEGKCVEALPIAWTVQIVPILPLTRGPVNR